MQNQYDIIIIGTGTGGGTIAKKLAGSGKKILILERGGFIPKEKQNWDPHEVVTLGRYRPKENWYDKDDKPFLPYIHYNVGGNSKMYGATLFRFRESDFEEVKHYGGKSPAWPFGYVFRFVSFINNLLSSNMPTFSVSILKTYHEG